MGLGIRIRGEGIGLYQQPTDDIASRTILPRAKRATGFDYVVDKATEFELGIKFHRKLLGWWTILGNGAFGGSFDKMRISTAIPFLRIIVSDSPLAAIEIFPTGFPTTIEQQRIKARINRGTRSEVRWIDHKGKLTSNPPNYQLNLFGFPD